MPDTPTHTGIPSSPNEPGPSQPITSGDLEDTAINRPLFQDGQYVGHLIRDDATGNLFLHRQGEVGSQPFTPGFYVVGSGSTVEVDNAGNIRDTFGPATSPGGSSFGEDLTLLRERFRLQQSLNEANRTGDTAQAIELRRLQEEIDTAAEQRGWDRQVWKDAVDRHHELTLLGREEDFVREMTERREGFEAEQSQLSRENQLRLSLISNIGALRRAQLELKAEANRELAATLGTDPFRSAVAQRGGIQVGRTPAQAFRTDLQRTATERIPQVDVLSAPLSELSQEITGRQEAIGRAPQRPVIGLQGGGRIKLGAGGGFTVQRDGGGLQQAGSVLVGEQGPELLERAGGSELTARPAGGGFGEEGRTLADIFADAREGRLLGPVDVPAPTDFDPLTMERAIGRIFERVGLPPVRTQAGNTLFQQEGLPSSRVFGDVDRPLGDVFSQLGVRPTLFRDPETGQVFGRDEQGIIHSLTGTGGLASILQLNKLAGGAVEPGQIVELAPGQLAELGPMGESFMGKPEGTELIRGFDEGLFPAPRAPIIEPVTGLALPTPEAGISLLRPGRLSDAERQLIFGQGGAFELAGFSQAEIERRRRFFTPAGSGGGRVGTFA